MKTTAFLLVFSASLLIGEGTAEAMTPAFTTSTSVHPTTTQQEGIFRRKKKGYRRKKGFMWGLFKKKDCGCPKI